jgi:hypothetical protein
MAAMDHGKQVECHKALCLVIHSVCRVDTDASYCILPIAQVPLVAKAGETDLGQHPPVRVAAKLALKHMEKAIFGHHSIR